MPRGDPAHPPAFVPDAWAALLPEVRRTSAQLHFLDCSSTGMARNMGCIRNQGILLAVSHFETLGVDGLIANLDADTAIPEHYISQLAYMFPSPRNHIKQASLSQPMLREKPIVQAISNIFDRYHMRFTERAWHLWLATQARDPVMNITDLQVYFMQNTAITGSSLKSNVLDFMENILEPRAPESYHILRGMIAQDVQGAEREIQSFQKDIHQIVHETCASYP